MNEVQRTVMTQNIRNLAWEVHSSGISLQFREIYKQTAIAENRCDALAWDPCGTELFPQFREIYRALREYDIADKTQWTLNHLSRLGLIESEPQD